MLTGHATRMIESPLQALLSSWASELFVIAQKNKPALFYPLPKPSTWAPALLHAKLSGYVHY